MNTNDIEYVIGKTKELLSAGVDVAKPAAFEIVMQVQLYNAAYVALGALFLVTAIAMVVYGSRLVKKSDDCMDAEFNIGMASCLVAMFIALGSIFCISNHLGPMVAPLPEMLKLVN